MRDDDHAPVSVAEAKSLFAPWKDAPALLLAVSGGPDSVALMWLAARWRRSLSRGPRLLAVTVDHGLRPEAAREARDVKQLARMLEVAHRTMKWTGTKPDTGIPAAARAERYRLLARAARSEGATHILTAHTRDDQAETLLMRMLRGSGIAGLSAMTREIGRDGVILARPLLSVPKSRLVATLDRAGIVYADDPTNCDTTFTRPRLRALLPLLAAEGGDARSLARLASRFARANAAIEVLTDGAERYLAMTGRAAPRGQAREFDSGAFASLPEEIRLRLLTRAIDTFGHEGPAELGKVETLLAALDRCFAEKPRKTGPKGQQIRLKQTLAGALVSVSRGTIRIEPAPLRRRS